MHNKATSFFALGALALAVSTAALAQMPQGALRVLGIEPSPMDSSVSGTLQSAAVQNRQLHLVVQGLQAPVVVAPWTPALPSVAAFKNPKPQDTQTVQVRSAMNPFGPTQSISVQRSTQSQPWLTVQTGAQSGQKLVDNWTVLNTADRWWLLQASPSGEQRSYLHGVQRIRAYNANWCVYPMARAASQEVPALLDWVLVQLPAGRTVCPR